MKYLLLYFFLIISLTLHSQKRDPITPLIKTHWEQGKPYNQKCPIIRGQHAVTGCVATAMAQVMKYHQWPADAFDWQNMLATYDATATDVQKDAVAELMADCGKSVNMDYGVTTSAAWEGDAAKALVETYSYAKSVREIFRNMYGQTSWSNLIYHELEQGRPVFYGGMPRGFNHQFVCDGYLDGKFHFNMAWQYLPDGYYQLNELDVYPEGQTAIIGIQTSCADDVNTSFTQGPLVYTVLDAGEVSVRMNADAPAADSLFIPAQVENEGRNYQVTTIEYGAFEDCQTLIHISIPASVSVIGHRALLGCTQLQTIEVNGDNVWYEADAQVLKSRVLPELIAYPNAKTTPNYSVPDGITAIPASFFRGNTYLEHVDLPASLASIDVLAFRGCTSLHTIFSASLQPKAVEEMSFDDDTYANATLLVPAAASQRYRGLAGWKNFKHIEEVNLSDLTSVSALAVSDRERLFYRLDGRVHTSSHAREIFIDPSTRQKRLSR